MRFFVIFFSSWIEAIKAPEKQTKMVLLKFVFAEIFAKKSTKRRLTLESKIEKLANTLQSWTPSSLTLRGFFLRAGYYNTV